MVKKHKLPCFAKLLFTLCSATFRYFGKVIRCLNLHALNQKMIMKNKEMQTRGTNLDINFLPTFNILSLVNLLKSKCNRTPRYFVNFKLKKNHLFFFPFFFFFLSPVSIFLLVNLKLLHGPKGFNLLDKQIQKCPAEPWPI